MRLMLLNVVAFGVWLCGLSDVAALVGGATRNGIDARMLACGNVGAIL